MGQIAILVRTGCRTTQDNHGRLVRTLRYGNFCKAGWNALVEPRGCGEQRALGPAMKRGQSMVFLRIINNL